MKALFLVFSLVGFCSSLAYAQDKGKDTKYKRFSFPNIDIPLQDSLQQRKNINLDSFIQKGDNSASMPNAYAKENGLIYTMPVKNLKGKGLAPMPGTENLDLLEIRGQFDSLKNLGKDKK